MLRNSGAPAAQAQAPQQRAGLASLTTGPDAFLAAIRDAFDREIQNAPGSSSSASTSKLKAARRRKAPFFLGDQFLSGNPCHNYKWAVCESDGLLTVQNVPGCTAPMIETIAEQPSGSYYFWEGYKAFLEDSMRGLRPWNGKSTSSTSASAAATRTATKTLPGARPSGSDDEDEQLVASIQQRLSLVLVEAVAKARANDARRHHRDWELQPFSPALVQSIAKVFAVFTRWEKSVEINTQPQQGRSTPLTGREKRDSAAPRLLLSTAVVDTLLGRLVESAQKLDKAPLVPPGATKNDAASEEEDAADLSLCVGKIAQAWLRELGRQAASEVFAGCVGDEFGAEGPARMSLEVFVLNRVGEGERGRNQDMEHGAESGSNDEGASDAAGKNNSANAKRRKVDNGGQAAGGIHLGVGTAGSGSAKKSSAPRASFSSEDPFVQAAAAIRRVAHGGNVSVIAREAKVEAGESNSALLLYRRDFHRRFPAGNGDKEARHHREPSSRLPPSVAIHHRTDHLHFVIRHGRRDGVMLTRTATFLCEKFEAAFARLLHDHLSTTAVMALACKMRGLGTVSFGTTSSPAGAALGTGGGNANAIANAGSRVQSLVNPSATRPPPMKTQQARGRKAGLPPQASTEAAVHAQPATGELSPACTSSSSEVDFFADMLLVPQFFPGVFHAPSFLRSAAEPLSITATPPFALIPTNGDAFGVWTATSSGSISSGSEAEPEEQQAPVQGPVVELSKANKKKAQAELLAAKGTRRVTRKRVLGQSEEVGPDESRAVTAAHNSSSSASGSPTADAVSSCRGSSVASFAARPRVGHHGGNRACLSEDVWKYFILSRTGEKLVEDNYADRVVLRLENNDYDAHHHLDGTRPVTAITVGVGPPPQPTAPANASAPKRAKGKKTDGGGHLPVATAAPQIRGRPAIVDVSLLDFEFTLKKYGGLLLRSSELSILRRLVASELALKEDVF